LKNVSVEIMNEDFTIIFGPSGCGKSTLLHTILGLEQPTEGSVVFLDTNLYEDTDEDFRSEFRKKHIGMVYQQPNWIKSLNVIENVAFPLLLLGKDKADCITESNKILEAVGMNQWLAYSPSELSSGQQQRVALARALITNPEVIIADEPTGNLDYEAGQKLMELLTDLNKREGKTILMVTHDLEYLKYAKTGVGMINGTVDRKYEVSDRKEMLEHIKSKRGNGNN